MENKDKKELEEVFNGDMPSESNLVSDDLSKTSIIELPKFDDGFKSSKRKKNKKVEDDKIEFSSFESVKKKEDKTDIEPSFVPLDNLDNNESNNIVDNESYNYNINQISDNNLSYDTLDKDYIYNNTEIKEDTINSNSKSNLDDKLGFIKDKIDNMYLDYKTRLIINISGVVLFVSLFLIFLITSISINEKGNINYKQASNLDYKVYLKPNNYYSEKYLDKNMQYIASLIDNVDVNFNYNFRANEEINYKYTYYVKSEVRVANSDDSTKVIYSKSDRVTEPVTLSKENSLGFDINQNIKVDYNKYNDQIKSFKSSYLINADSNLILSLCVGVEDQKGNKIKDINTNEVMSLNIPLTQQMINISMNYKETNNSNNAKIYKDFNISNKVLFAFSILSLIGTLIYIVLLVMFLRKTSTKKTIYDITLSKILREYDRVIVNSRKPIAITGEIIELSSFNELLDVRDNLEKPIIFKEIHKGQKSVFVVKNGDETYRYVLKLADLEKGNTK